MSSLFRETSIQFPPELVGKKVLLATESLGPVNGVSRTTQSLIDYLRNNGVNVATVAPHYNGESIVQTHSRTVSPCINEKTNEGTSTPTRDNPELRLDGWPLPYNPDMTVVYPFEIGSVYRKTFVPDLIYLASPASVGFTFLLQLGQLDSPPPTLLNFQTDLAAYSTILLPAPLDRYGVFLLQKIQGYLFRMAVVKIIFYPSAGVRKYLEAAKTPSDKMVRLGRGVDTKLFHLGQRDEAYRKEIAPNDEIIFCCICRLAPEKGFAFLAEAARKLRDSGLRFKLLIVGGNKSPVVEHEVRYYFQDLQDQVIFTGFLRGADLARAYASADVFLHCSITETFGLVVLESMASGVPVVARDEGGPSEIVKNGRSGYLVPPHESELFVKCAYQLATNASLRSEMGKHARRQALETTWDKINNKVALQLAANLDNRGPVGKDPVYGSWLGRLRVYAAVGVVCIFWIIAVIPMLVCGTIYGHFK